MRCYAWTLHKPVQPIQPAPAPALIVRPLDFTSRMHEPQQPPVHHQPLTPASKNTRRLLPLGAAKAPLRLRLSHFNRLSRRLLQARTLQHQTLNSLQFLRPPAASPQYSSLATPLCTAQIFRCKARSQQLVDYEAQPPTVLLNNDCRIFLPNHHF